MKIFTDRFHRLNNNRRRFEMEINGVSNSVRIRRFLDIDMGDLPERMHPGVGAARALDQTFFLCESIHRVLERRLHGLAI